MFNTLSANADPGDMHIHTPRQDYLDTVKAVREAVYGPLGTTGLSETTAMPTDDNRFPEA